VELSLRRLSAVNRERVRVLGVFHGGVQLGVLQAMTGSDSAEVEGLAQELVGTGLATENAYGHLSFNPALGHYLRGKLAARELEKLTARWGQEMTSYLEYLRHQVGQNAEQAATLTLLELPNLFALLERLQGAAAPEETIALASSIYSLLQNLGKPRLVERLGRVRDAAAAELGASWSHARFEATRNRIQQQLAGRQLGEALAGAQQLFMQARSAGEQAYIGADYDLALACLLLGQVHKLESRAKKAIPLLQEAGQRFKAFAKEHPRKGAERMASVCLSEQGACELALFRYGEAADAYEETIRCSEQLGDERNAAVNKAQLGTVRLFQERYWEALAAHVEARDIFTRLKEPTSVAKAWHQIGFVNERAAQPKAAEEAYNQSLAMNTQLGEKAGQADTLLQLGNLYDDVLNKPELAVTCCRRAAEIYADPAIGDFAKEGLARSNLADILRRLSRLDEARHAIERAIACKATFGNEAEPWKTLMILSAIEQDDCNPAAAAKARHLGIDAFLAYRRDGGENQSGSGRLALEVRQALASGDPGEATSLLQQLAADPQAASMLPFLTALQAITAGSRDRSLAEDPGLTYDQAAEVLLLIEALEAEAGG
jgi:tetratricopeptide (TPR) repeat protein